MKPSGWDRFLISLFPRWGMERLRARAATDALARHYEAAAHGRRTEGWRRPASDADLALRGVAAELRFHARDLLRNNGFAQRGQSTIANNTVGWGILPTAIGASEQTNASAMTLWRAWAGSTECESDNRATFYGIQRLAMNALVSDGEVLVRRRPRKARDALTIPLQLQVLEIDYLDSSKNLLESQAGGPIIQGIEFDKLGRRAAYWLWAQHPGSGRNQQISRRIDADELIHLYDPKRPGASRAVSWLGSAIVNLRDLDELDDAELMKAKIAACFAAFVSDTDGTGTALGSTDAEPNDDVDRLEPGMILNLEPGKTVTTASPPSVTSDALAVRTLRRVAAGLGITYEDLSGDYSQVNFSSARMGRLAHWGNVHHWQQNVMIPILCQGVWTWAMDLAVLAGELPEAPRAQWTPPGMPMLEPDREGLALARLVRAGALTPSEMVREQGHDPEEHWREYAADFARLDALKIKIDSDVRAVTQAGLAQSQPGTPAPPGGGE